MLPHLGFDIQVEIIKVLPVKSLIRFKSVCKAWKSLIDSSHFIAGYNDRHDLPQHLVVKYEVGRNGEERHQVKYVSFIDDDDDNNDSFPQQKFALTVPPIVQAKETRIIDSSYGLLCLTDYLGETDLDDYYFEAHYIAVLWNPTIRKSIVVRLPDVVEWPFDFVIGFGVCPDTKDALLVKIKYIGDSYLEVVERIRSIPNQVMVFTLSSGKWTCLCSSKLPSKSIEFSSDRDQVVIGQFIYWFACDRFDLDGGRSRNVIMSFDMSTHEFRVVDLPDHMARPHESCFSISRLRESLVVVRYLHMVKRICDVWMMEDGDSNAFTKLFTINLPIASVSRTLGFRKSGEPIVETYHDYSDYDTPSALVVYEPCSEHVKDLGIRGNRLLSFVSSYKESLLLLDHVDVGVEL